MQMGGVDIDAATAAVVAAIIIEPQLINWCNVNCAPSGRRAIQLDARQQLSTPPTDTHLKRLFPAARSSNLLILLLLLLLLCRLLQPAEPDGLEQVVEDEPLGANVYGRLLPT